MLTECERRASVKLCPRCREAVAVSEYKEHAAQKVCKGIAGIDVFLSTNTIA
jgi:hypothetical protein